MVYHAYSLLHSCDLSRIRNDIAVDSARRNVYKPSASDLVVMFELRPSQTKQDLFSFPYATVSK